MAPVKPLPTASVVRREDLTADLMILHLRPNIPYTFKAGQYCTIGLDGIERPYSIASSPHEGILELFLELVPSRYRRPTSLTPRLWRLRVGDDVTLRPRAKGKFLFDDSYVTHVMVATVTGVAPFVSMCRSSQAGYCGRQDSYSVYLFQGASYSDEFGYRRELTAMAKSGALVYVPTVSRPNEARNRGWSGQTGRVHSFLSQHLRMFGITPDDTVVYLCGNESMVVDLGSTAKGKPPGRLVTAGYRVKSEVYF